MYQNMPKSINLKYKNMKLLKKTKEFNQLTYSIIKYLNFANDVKISYYYLDEYNTPFFDLNINNTHLIKYSTGYSLKVYYSLYNYFYKVLMLRIYFKNTINKSLVISRRNRYDKVEDSVHNNFLLNSLYKRKYTMFLKKIKQLKNKSISNLYKEFILTKKYDIFTKRDILELFFYPFYQKIIYPNDIIFKPIPYHLNINFKKILDKKYNKKNTKFQIFSKKLNYEWNVKFWETKTLNKKILQPNVLAWYNRKYDLQRIN